MQNDRETGIVSANIWAIRVLSIVWLLINMFQKLLIIYVTLRHFKILLKHFNLDTFNKKSLTVSIYSIVWQIFFIILNFLFANILDAKNNLLILSLADFQLSSKFFFCQFFKVIHYRNQKQSSHLITIGFQIRKNV